jgi:homoserine O-acetyltransferase
MKLRAAALALALSATSIWPVLAYDGIVTKQTFEMPGPYATVGGKTIKQVKIGYETIGKLNAAGDNAILIPHFFSGTSHFAGKYKPDDKTPGYWDAIVGPGKALDSDKYFLIGVDSLSNINAKDGVTVTTGPASVDPDTGKPYGMSFPQVQMRDFVNVQKALLDKLGVKKLHAVMGASMGAIQSWEWAAAYPEMVERVVTVIGAPIADAYTLTRIKNWRDVITLDPKWKGGDYYGGPEPVDGLTMAFKLINVDALAPEWGDDRFGRKPADPAKDPAAALDNDFAMEAWNTQAASARAKIADANNLIYLARANELFAVGGKPTLEEGLKLVKAKALIIPSKNDLLLFPDYSRRARDLLKAQGNAVEYVELEGPMGHLNGVAMIAQAEPAIRKFLSE